MSTYSIPDLVDLLRRERGERVLLEAGSAPTLIIKGELHAIEGPALGEESLEEMLRAVASTREMRAFRESGTVDVVFPFDRSRYLIRAVHALGVARVEVQPITLQDEDAA